MDSRNFSQRFARATAAILLFLPAMLEAQAIIAPGGRTLFNKNILLRSFLQIQRQSTGADSSDISTTYLQPVALVYGVAPDWNVTAVVPFVLGGDSGVADAQFFIKYDGLYKKNVPGGVTRLVAEVGVQAPTGSDRYSTGAFGFNGDLIFEVAQNQKFLITDLYYQQETRNDEGVKAGNRFGFDLATAYLFLPDADDSWNGLKKLLGHLFQHGIFGILELNGQIQKRAEEGPVRIDDSGGTTIFLSPGLQYFLRPNLIVDFSVPIPIVRNLNGEQPEPLVGILIGFRIVL